MAKPNFILHLIDKIAIPTKTSLIKMCYLCDLVAFRENGKQITDFKYIRYYYGPFDKLLTNADCQTWSG